jgi:hypothetical protein
LGVVLAVVRNMNFSWNWLRWRRVAYSVSKLILQVHQITALDKKTPDDNASGDSYFDDHFL